MNRKTRRKTLSCLGKESPLSVRHKFNVRQPTEDFLTSVGLLPFAVLSKESDKNKTLSRVVQTLEKIPHKSKRNNIAACTEILAGLVLEKTIIRQLLREDIMKESVIYQDIIQKGMERGIQQGTQETQTIIALRMLENKMPIDLIVQLTDLPLEKVQELRSKIE